MSALTGGKGASTLLPRTWRVTTASRVFVLALAVGNSVATDGLDSLGITILAIGLVFAVSAAVELAPASSSTSWPLVVEGVLVAVLVGSSVGQVDPLLACLLVPPVVAGVRNGWVSSVNTSLASCVTIAAVWMAAQTQGGQSDLATAAAVTWLAVGLGAGLLAGWLTRDVRALEDSRAPYAAAHRLVTQLHTLSRQVPMGLDSQTLAQDVLDRARHHAQAGRGVVLVRYGERSVVPLVSHGPGEAADDEVALACLRRDRPVAAAGTAGHPLRLGDHTFGVVVLADAPVHPPNPGLQDLLDELAVRLHTALLFDEVRTLATTEERNRLARDIHDGLAQEVASLGYLVDDLVGECTDEQTRRSAEGLRLEISRVVSEVRFSIFDLRHGVDEANGLSGALRDYVREVGSHTGLQVHLRLDESGAPLPRRTESELLRIAQEAVANVRKHADATSVWVSLVTDGRYVHLTIEDDGVGGAGIPRPGHYGLHVMSERARRINADLTIGDRPGGGTRLTVESRSASAVPEGEIRVHPRPARR